MLRILCGSTRARTADPLGVNEML